MNAIGRLSTISLLYGLVVMTVFNPTIVSPTLCESKCENAVPSLKRLKVFWHSISKREGGEDVSFTYFIKALLDAARRYGDLFPLKKNLELMVFEYKDCVKACEHQHSKRSRDRREERNTSIKNCLPYFACYYIASYDDNDEKTVQLST